jgi:hypothetical protein
MGAAVMVFAGFPDSISFAAAASGGAIIDFDAISGAVVAAGAFEIPWPTDETAAGPDTGTATSVSGFSAIFVCVVASADTTGAGGGFWAAD